MPVTIKEKLDFYDFMEANFPQVLKPFYKRRLFIINMAFGLLFLVATVYLYYESYRNHIRFESIHYAYLFFTLLFTFLAFYLLRRERKIYRETVRKINDLNTIYIFDNQYVKVRNKQVDLTYKIKDVKKVIELPKWLLIIFNNDERIHIYKPNATAEQLKKINDLLLF